VPSIRNSVLSRFPQLQANYSLSFFDYLELARRCAVMKSIWYSMRFRGPVIVGRRSKIAVSRTARVSIASSSLLVVGMAHDTPAGAVLRLRPRSLLRVDGRVQIMRGSNVTVGYDAELSVGAGTFLNDGSSVFCCSSISIGSGCAISWGTRILDTDVHKIIQAGLASQHAPVSIGRNCWIGADAVILKGSTLGHGSVVAAGAVVTSEVPPRSLVAGVPARVVREDVDWEL
jgi:acetyltransferase-like isoleucine patch superfamily enzyme